MSVSADGFEPFDSCARTFFEPMLCVAAAGHQALDRLFCFASFALGQHMLDNARVADAQLSMCGGRCSDAVVYFELLV